MDEVDSLVGAMQTSELTKHSKLVDFSQALSAAANDLERYPALREHAAAFSSVAHDLLLPPLVVVMGAFNAGKSTLLNALLGESLLNMHVLPATATVTMLRKGKNGVIFGHANGIATRTWPLSDLTSLSAEGDAESAKTRQSLSFVEVPLENPLLDRVTLVDTPGLNSPNEAHTRATEDFIHRAQAVLWIVSCLQPLNEQERSWIERLPAGIKVLVVINQIDQLDPEEDSLPRLVERVKNNIQRPNVNVTAVSAKLALDSFLRTDKGLLSQSLWESFFAALESEVIDGDKSLRFRQAASDVLALIESLNKTLANDLLEVEGNKLRARGGNDYHDDLQRRIGALSNAEQQLVRSQDAIASLESLEIPDGWEVPEDTLLKQQVLIGATLALSSEQSTLDYESASMNERFQSHSSEVRQLEADTETYNKSGLFGGAPIIFDGKKKKLEARGLRLVSQKATLQTEQNTLYAKLRTLKERRNRTRDDCTSLIEVIIDAMRQTMVSVVKESHDTVGQQRIAAAKLLEFKWLQDFAVTAKTKHIWFLQAQVESLSTDEDDRVRVDGAFNHFSQMMESLCRDKWFVSVPTPLALPSSTQRLLPQEEQAPKIRVRMRQGAIAKGLLVAAALAVVISLFLIARRPAPIPVASVPVIDVQQKPAASPLPPVVDDYESIRAVLLSEGYTADGAMTDVAGLTPSSPLHVQRVSCNSSGQSCKKLLVFAGARAIWSENVDPTADISVASEASASFTTRLLKRSDDGTESTETAQYKWDGSLLDKTVIPAPDIVQSIDSANAAPEVSNGSGTARENAPQANIPPVLIEPARSAPQPLRSQSDTRFQSPAPDVSSRTTTASTLHDLGLQYATTGNYEAAIEKFDEALELDSRYAQAFTDRGKVFLTLGRYTRAINDFDQALRLDAYQGAALAGKRLAQGKLSAGYPDHDQFAPHSSNPPSSQRMPYAANDSLAESGQRVFELQHYHLADMTLHRARLTLSATSLDYLPEGPCKYQAFTIPLTAIKSVGLGKNFLGEYLLNIKYEVAGVKKSLETKGQISFAGPYTRISPGVSPPPSAQEIAFLTSAKDAILVAKSTAGVAK